MIPRYVPAHTLRDVMHALMCRKDEVVYPAFLGNSSSLVLPVESACSGLKMVLQAMGIKGRVVIPAYTCILVPEVVASCACEPVFVDVSSANGTMSADMLKQFAPGDIDAIIATHMHGVPCDIEGIMEQAQRLGALVIEDCALAVGSCIGDFPVGSFAPVAIFSTGRGKTVNLGGGGLLVINEAMLAEKVRNYWLQHDRSMGSNNKYLALAKLMLGTREAWTLLYPMASRLKRLVKGTWFWERSLRHEVVRSPTVLCGEFSKVLPSLLGSLDIERQFAHRRLIGRIYRKNIIELSGRIHQFEIKPEHDVVWPSFPLWVSERDELFSSLRRKGIDCGLTFSYGAAAVFSGEFSINAEKIAESILTLPVHEGVSEHQAISIADWVNECSGKYKNGEIVLQYDNVTPHWIVVRPGVAILEPFLVGEEPLPSLLPGTWLGRVVWDYDSSRVDQSAKANAWICDDKSYDLKSLHLKARNQTRKAEKEGAKVSKVDWGMVSKFIPDLVRQTFERQGRNSAKVFLEYLGRLRVLDGSKWNGAVELWVAEREGIVGALILGMKYGKTYHILHQLSDTASLSWCPNNLLTFTVTQHAFKDLCCEQVNYGVDGLDQGKLDGLATFKTRMGYKLMPCKEQFIGKPGVITGIRLLSTMSELILWAFPSFSRIETLRVFKMLGKRI